VTSFRNRSEARRHVWRRDRDRWHRQALAWRWRIDDVVADDSHVVGVEARREQTHELDAIPPALRVLEGLGNVVVIDPAIEVGTLIIRSSSSRRRKRARSTPGGVLCQPSLEGLRVASCRAASMFAPGELLDGEQKIDRLLPGLRAATLEKPRSCLLAQLHEQLLLGRGVLGCGDIAFAHGAQGNRSAGRLGLIHLRGRSDSGRDLPRSRTLHRPHRLQRLSLRSQQTTVRFRNFDGPCTSADASTTTAPRYTLSPRKRTDGGVHRRRQPSAAQQKLARTVVVADLHPRGLRGSSPRRAGHRTPNTPPHAPSPRGPRRSSAAVPRLWNRRALRGTGGASQRVDRDHLRGDGDVPRKISSRFGGASSAKKSGIVCSVRRGRRRNSTGHSVTRSVFTCS
jgi:hypothetical protein